MIPTTNVVIDGREHSVPLAFRAVHLLAIAGLDGTYRLFQERDGLLEHQLYWNEWITPAWGDRFVCIPHCIGPGGGDDRRIKLIQAASAAENGDEEAWQRFMEYDRD